MKERGRVFGDIRKSTANLDVQAIERLITEKSAETGGGRSAKDIRKWTIEALQAVLREKTELRDQAHQREATVREHDLRETKAAAILSDARELLTLISARSEDWPKPYDASPVMPTKQALLENMERTVVSASGETGKGIRGERQDVNIDSILVRVVPPNEDRIFGDPDFRLQPGATPEPNEPMALVERTRYWGAIDMISRIAERVYAASSIRDQDPSAGTRMDPVTLRYVTRGGVAIDVGGEKLDRTIAHIVASSPAFVRDNEEQFWKYVRSNWNFIQRQIDDSISIESPRSLREAFDRVKIATDILRNHPATKKYANGSLAFSQNEQIALAKGILDRVCKPLDRSAIAQKFPDLDAEFVTNPHVTFAQSLDQTAFLIKAVPDWLKHRTDLPREVRHCRFTEPTLIKQWVATLHPGEDLSQFNEHEWIAGYVPNPSEFPQKRLEADTYTAERRMRNGLERTLLQKFNVNQSAYDVAKNQFNRWSGKRDGLTHSYGPESRDGRLPIVVDFDQQDAMINRINFGPQSASHPPAYLSIHPAPSTAVWLGFGAANHAMFEVADSSNEPANAGLTSRYARGKTLFHTLLQRAYPNLRGEIDIFIDEEKGSIDTSRTGWQLTLLDDPGFMERAIRRVSSIFTRQDPASLVEAADRYRIIGALVTSVLVPGSEGRFYPFDLGPARDSASNAQYNLAYDQNIQRYYDERKIPTALDQSSVTCAPYLATLDALGIPESAYTDIHFVRQGNSMCYVYRSGAEPKHRIFRSDTFDEETTLDYAMAVNYGKQRTMEDMESVQVVGNFNEQQERDAERGQWIAGRLPAIDELEGRYLSMGIVDDKFLPAPETEGGPADEAVPVVDEEHTSEPNEDRPIPRLRAVRNALLRQGVSATFTLDQRTHQPTSNQYGTAEKGHYVVVTIPDANMQILVSDDRTKGTRVIYNMLNPKHYTTVDIATLDNQCGRIRLHYNDTDQFTSIVSSTIAQRIADPSLTIYPVDSDYPTPLDAFPNNAALEPLRRDFEIAARMAGKTIQELTVSDFARIESDETVWSFGGAACGQAYLDRLAREFGLHASTINRKLDAAAAEGDERAMSLQQEGDLHQADFRSAILKTVLNELSPEFRGIQQERAIRTDKSGRAHSASPRRKPRGKTGGDEPVKTDEGT